MEEDTSENKDLPAETMGETEGTEVRDIKKEKVKVLMEKNVFYHGLILLLD